ncbi:MAG: hypothetical protein K0Q52_292 [Microbacterium sp.]|nr:hypothetical protein [Microbacterium sp.]
MRATPSSSRRKWAMLAASLFMGAVLMADIAVPAPAAIAAVPAAVSVATSHPRLLVSSANDFATIRSNTGTDAVSARLQKDVLNSANYQLTLPVVSYDLQNPESTLTTAKYLVERSYTLSMAWRLTNDAKYMEGLWKNLDAASKFPDWNPKNFLHTAEIANAFAISYDWGYSYWTDARRATLRNAMLTKAIRPAIPLYESPESDPNSWVTATHNRNVVGNGGVGLASLAIVSEDTSGDAQKVLDYSIESIKSGLTGYLPDGSYPEGPMYWEYATEYASTFLNALKTATGSTQGLDGIGGIARSGAFIRDLMTPSGDIFTFADSETAVSPAMEFSGLARLTGDTSLEGLSAANETSRQAAQRLVWRNPSVPPVAPASQSRPRVANYADGGVATARGDATDVRAPYAALRYGGDPTVGHRHVDAGDVMVSVGGVTWAQQLGLDRSSYDARGNGGAVSERWNYYRNRLEGHNTLTLDRDSTHDFRDAPGGSLLSSGTSAVGSFAVADLSAAQGAAAGTWRRGVRVLPTSQQVVLQDEFTAPAGTTSRWGLHTSAQVEITQTGRSAVLYKDGQRLLVELSASSGVRFRATPAVPSPISPRPEQDENTGVTKLVVDVPGGSAQTVAVTMTLLAPTATTASRAGQVTAMNGWGSAPEAAVQLSRLTVDGAGLQGFNASRRSYTVMRDPALPAPKIVARNTSGGTVSVRATTSMPGSYLVGSDLATGVLVTFVPDLTAVKTSTASSTTRGTPGAAHDGNESSGWATSGVQYLELTFRGQIDLNKVDILWTANSSRRIDYRILIPKNDTWAAAASGSYRSASGWSSNTIDSPPRVSKIRIEVSGDPGGDRTSTIREIAISGFRGTPAPANLTPGAWGVSSANGPSTLAVEEWAPLGVTISGAAANAQIELVSGNRGVARIDGTGAVGAAPGSTVLGAYARVGAWEFPSPARALTVVPSQALSLLPVQDTFVEGGASASKNFAGADRLDVKPTLPATPSDGTRVRTSLLRFDLSGVDTTRIASAVLVLTGAIADSAGGDAVRVDAYRPASTWTDTTVTYQNRPGFGAPLGSTLVTRQTGESRLDLTDAAKKTPSAQLSAFDLALGGSAPDNAALMARFGSSESSTPPRLEIVLAPAKATVSTSSATNTLRGTSAATHDGSTSTGWAGRGGATITWVLPQATLLKTVRAAWSPDASQKVSFKLLTSSDGKSWNNEGTYTYSGGPGTADHSFRFSRKVTQVRLELVSSSSTWQAVLREVELLSPGSPPAALPDRLFADATVSMPAKIAIGQTVGVPVKVVDITGATIDKAQVKHVSDSTSVVSVGTDGRLTGRATGVANITTTVSQGPLSRSFTTAVTVYQPGLFTIRTDGDTFSQGGGTADTTLGGLNRLDVKPQSPGSAADGGNIRTSYLTFDLTGTTPASTKSATLALYGSLIDDPSKTQGTVDIYTVSGSWSESTTTYANRPQLGQRIASFTVTREAKTWKIDLTEYIKKLPAGTKRISIALGGTVATTPEALMSRFNSKEAGEATAPTLTIQENVPAG